MIAAISPADYNYDETLSTLRYASRAKSIKNKPKINEDPKDALLRQYEEEIKALKEMLDKMQNGGQNNGQAGQPMIDPRMLLQSHLLNSSKNNTVESVDVLIQKLEGQGKKIKIISEEEEQEMRKKRSKKREKEQQE